MQRIRRKNISVNIVPLVDVLIILLFFFIITMRMPGDTQKMLHIMMPKMQTAGNSDVNNSLMIGIDREGDYFLDYQVVTKEQLVQGLEILSKESLNRTVIVLADEKSLLESVAFVMDACRKVGLERIELQTR